MWLPECLKAAHERMLVSKFHFMLVVVQNHQLLCVDAGFFLFAVQPFKLGDRVAVSYSSPAVGGGPPNSAWFEGIAEKTDLR